MFTLDKRMSKQRGMVLIIFFQVALLVMISQGLFDAMNGQ